MIQMLEIRTGSAIWEIDGTILRFRRLKNVGDAVVERRINQYKSLLLEERYRANQEELIGITEILGEVILLKIGSEAFYKKFFQMFRFYCSRFMEAWKSSEKYMVSNKVSMFPALQYITVRYKGRRLVIWQHCGDCLAETKSSRRSFGKNLQDSG